MKFDKETVEKVLKDYDKYRVGNIGPYGAIYRKLKALGVLDITEYKKITAPGFMDLSIDVLSNNDKEMTIAMAHNFIQEGDVMADPDMEIKIHKELEAAEALTFQQDSLGIYQEVYPEPGKVNIRLKRELNQFLNHWLDNLAAQGFYSNGDN
jgi:uncharacterized protein YqiB (DUF1249 family)